MTPNRKYIVEKPNNGVTHSLQEKGRKISKLIHKSIIITIKGK